jgi:hypothetical protein
LSTPFLLASFVTLGGVLFVYGSPSDLFGYHLAGASSHLGKCDVLCHTVFLRGETAVTAGHENLFLPISE